MQPVFPELAAPVQKYPCLAVSDPRSNPSGHISRHGMNMLDLVGYLAAAMVFIAFYMKDMVLLRVVALGSNVAFLVYALGLHLVPVATLHMALVPVNCWRLWEVIRAAACCRDNEAACRDGASAAGD
jgi:hypothetical protein